LLLQLKSGLEKLTERIDSDDILTFTKFLVLAAVVLPIVPDKSYTEYNLNPFHTWLVVVVVSGISYGSYLLQQVTKKRGGILLAALLGGAYSSTVTTIALSRRSRTESNTALFSGGILVASGMMYARLAILVSLFNRQLMVLLGLPFLGLSAAAVLGGWGWSRRKEKGPKYLHRDRDPPNPLELRAALLFAGLFLAMLVVTKVAVTTFGKAGVYFVAAVMGVSDVDPFILGMTQSAGTLTPIEIAAAAITIAAASNNFAKAAYAYALSSPASRWASMLLLVGLGVVGLAPLLLW